MARSTAARQGPGRGADLVRLGGWRWPALGFCTTVLGFFLVLPLGVLVWWSVQADPVAGRAEVAWGAALNSGAVSAVVAAVAVVVVLPAAVLAWRYPSRLSRILERLTLFPSAIPGIAVALALVFFGARIGGFLYQSLALLRRSHTSYGSCRTPSRRPERRSTP